MPNAARFIFKNLAKVTGVNGTSAAGYPAANLLNSDKAVTFRATGKTVTLTGAYTAPITASGLALAHTNFSSSATGRLRLYSDFAGTVLVRDVAATQLCNAPPVELEGWNLAQSASAYAYGGGADARLWFDETTFRAWRLDIDDVNNMQGYLEAAYLILGQHWSPTYDIDAGAGVKLCNSDVHKRTAAGSLRSRAGLRWRELPLDLSDLTKADFTYLLRKLRGQGVSPFLCALYPEDDDAILDAETTLIGKVTEESEFTLNGPDSFATKVTVRGL